MKEAEYIQMKKETMKLGLLSKTDAGYELELLHPWMKFEGPTREHVIGQAQVAYLKYYAETPKERQEVRKELVHFNIELPDAD